MTNDEKVMATVKKKVTLVKRREIQNNYPKHDGEIKK